MRRLFVKNSNEMSVVIELIEKQATRIESIEQLLKMLLIDNMLNEIDEVQPIDNEKSDSWITEIIIQKGLTPEGYDTINDMDVFYVRVSPDCKVPVKKLIDLKNECYEKDASLLLCFCFDFINGMKRKRLLEEQISFCVKDREVHIFPN